MVRMLIFCIIFLLKFTFAYAQEDKWLESNMKVYDLMGKMKYSEAISACKVSLEIAQKTFGLEHQNTITTLNLLASLYFSSQKYQDAELIYKNIIEINEKVYGEFSVNAVQPLLSVASLYQMQGKYSNAEGIYKKAIEIYEKIYGEEDAMVATPVLSLASMYQLQSKINESAEAYKRVLKIYQNKYGKESPVTLNIINSLANLFQTHGRYSEAEELFTGKEIILKQIVDSIEKQPGFNKQQLLQPLNDLASLFQFQGKYNESEDVYKKIVDINIQNYGHENAVTLSALNSLAFCYYVQGKYSKAEELYKDIILINEKTGNGDNQSISSALMILGSLYQMQKRYEEAEKIYNRLLILNEKLYGKESQLVSSTVLSIAMLRYFQNRYEESEALFKKSLEYNEKQFGKENIINSGVMLMLAHLKLLQNKFSEADSIYKKSIEVSEKFYGKESLFISGYLYSIAVMYYSQNKFTEADNYEKKALGIFEKTFGKDMSSVNNNYLYMIANIYYNQEEYSKAEQLFDKLISYLSDQFDKTFLYLSEKEKMGFIERNAYNFPGYFSFILKYSNINPYIIGKLYNLLLWQKGIVLSSTISIINNIIKSGDKESIKILDNLKGYKERLAKLYSSTQSEQEKNKKEIEYLENRANELESELTVRSKVYSTEKKLKNIKWDDIKKKLNGDEAAIEFLSFKYNDKKYTDSIFYLALLITKECENYPLLIKIGEERELKKMIELYKLSVSQDPLRKTLEKGNRQYGFLWKPIDKHLKNVKKIYLSPDGMLNQISFGVLVNDEGKFLNEEYELRYVSNTKDIFRDFDINKLNNYSVLIGNPNFSADTGTLQKNRGKIINENKEKEKDPARGLRSFDFKINPLMDLPGTKTEVENISSLLKQKKWKVDVFTENNAIEEAVKEVKSPRILHIATHGFFMPEQDIDINKQKLYSQLNQNKIFIAQENPMLRSGLFFAGANSLNKNDNLDDGILTAYEASNLNLQGTEFVVLSACETGLGDIKTGEGVFGLRRAFQSAGSEAVIMSLWSVPDKETQEMMSLFYSNWLNGMNKYSAFHSAQNEMRKTVKIRYGMDIPFYWGAFIMIGK